MKILLVGAAGYIGFYLAMIIVWAKTGVAWMERSLRSVIQVLLAERMIMAFYLIPTH